MCSGSSPLLGASESPLRQGFPPENACDAALAAVADRLCLFSFERLVFLSCLNLKLSAPSSLPAFSHKTGVLWVPFSSPLLGANESPLRRDFAAQNTRDAGLPAMLDSGVWCEPPAPVFRFSPKNRGAD